MHLLIALILASHVVIASLVTVHVLLRKADVRSALGWIAIAWLSVSIGGPLYVIFGINRVSRRAARLIGGRGAPEQNPPGSERPTLPARLVALSEISERITGAPLLAGNAITILRGGDDAYPAMLDAIARARHSIALGAYIFRYDATGRRFIEALASAHRRGVVVRVLLDGIGAGYAFSRVERTLRAEGVRAARFLHIWAPWHMPFLNLRNHKKLLIVDGATSFTGGLNISGENLADGAFPARIDDVHFRIHGPVTAQLLSSFAEDWSFATGETLEGDIWWPEPSVGGPVFARGVRSGPDADIAKLKSLLGSALAQAEKRVRIVTPYFLPDQRLQFAIIQACLRGVLVEIVIPERGDYSLINWAMQAHLRFFPDMRPEIRLSRAPFNHAKLMTIDGAWCLFGSSNWDTRSLRLNFEFDVECYDHDLCSRIDALIDAKIADGRTLTAAELTTAPTAARLRDAAARLLLAYL